MPFLIGRKDLRVEFMKKCNQTQGTVSAAWMGWCAWLESNALFVFFLFFVFFFAMLSLDWRASRSGWDFRIEKGKWRLAMQSGVDYRERWKQSDVRSVTCVGPWSPFLLRSDGGLWSAASLWAQWGLRNSRNGSWRRLSPDRGESWGGQVSGAEARCRPAACRRWLRGDAPRVFLAPATCAGDTGMLVRGRRVRRGGMKGGEKQRKGDTETEGGQGCWVLISQPDSLWPSRCVHLKFQDSLC